MSAAADTHFVELVQKVLHREGGYVNDPKDRGGETNFGISKKAFPKEDIKNMTAERATWLYKKHYWGPARCAQLPEGIRDIHLDTAINSGVGTAIKLLQRAAGVNDDGKFGPVTAAAAQHVTVRDYVKHRLVFIETIIRNDPSQLRFRLGWTKRVTAFLK